MIGWIPYTFVRTVVFFIGGILVGYYFSDLLPEYLAIAVAVFLMIVYFMLVRYRRRLRNVVNPGAVALPLVFVLGYAHILFQTESRNGNHILHTTEAIRYYRAIITKYPEQRERSWKIEARVDGIHTTTWEQRQGRIVLYFSKADFPQPFEYGNVLLIKGQPMRPDPAFNPGQFDYRRYLSFQNIYHQQFLRKGDVVKIGESPDHAIRAFAFHLRHWADETLRCFVNGEREQAIASALVLGVTDGLDNDLLDAYSATGTMHILAVSGLHISIIYLILLRLLSPLSRFKAGRWTVAFVSLVLLWVYAMVTGLSPSVLRAVMMFSFLAIARPWARSTNVYNTLAVSAFCLLIIDPFLIFSVGFQLSYMAVLGIVYIYPRILMLWQPGHVVTVEVWKLAAVSLAAQLATFPLGLLYFHQFPNYFLFSNLLVVPLSFMVLIAGLVLLVVSFIPVVATIIGFCLHWLIWFVNAIIFVMEDLPFALIDGIHVSVWQCLLLLLLIVFVLALLEEKRFRFVWYSFVTVIAFVALQWFHFWRDVNVRQLAVYHVPGHSAIDLIDRGQTLFMTDTMLMNDERTLRYRIFPNRLMTGVQKEIGPNNLYAFEGGRLVVWQGRVVVQITQAAYRLPTGVLADWVIVSNNAVSDVETIAKGIGCKRIVLDSSNSFFFATHFLEAAKLYKLDVHSVLHQGAFVTRI